MLPACVLLERLSVRLLSGLGRLWLAVDDLFHSEADHTPADLESLGLVNFELYRALRQHKSSKFR